MSLPPSIMQVHDEIMVPHGHLLGVMALDVSRMTGIPYTVERISSLGDTVPHIDLIALKWWDRWACLWAIIGGCEVTGKSVIDDSFDTRAHILQEKKHARNRNARTVATADSNGSEQ